MKSIFITGGASGIGRAAAIRFAREGWLVGIGDVNEAGLDETAALVQPGRCSAYRLDVRDRAAWDKALASFAEIAGGGIDVVFSNAGVAVSGAFLKHSSADVDRMLDINLRGVINGAFAAYPWLQKRAPGSCLIQTASVAGGIYGTFGGAVYSATKAAVKSMTESLAMEWQAAGVRVADIMPSMINTPMMDELPLGKNEWDMRAELTKAGLEITSVEEVADQIWKVAHGRRVHTLVGKSARQMAMLARWFPGMLPRFLAKTARPFGFE
jgi:NAD(P)-dependent dehydrogenase (short-subunit alcohol dehydrogenase family)